MRKTFLVLAMFTGLLAAFAQSDEQRLLAELKSYDYDKPRSTLRALELHIARSQGDQRERLADSLVALFADPATSMPARRFIARQLPRLASRRHVPTIARVLDDPKAAEMARRILEAIPGDESRAVLRGLIGKAKGRMLVGVVNSLGVRRDARAVPAISPLLRSDDEAVASAAAEALGKIATPEAAQALLNATPRPAARLFLRDALIQCALALSKSDAALARQIGDRLWKEAKSPGGRISALTALARVSPERAVPVLLTALDSGDRQLRATALALAATTPSPELTKALATRLAKAEPDQKIALIRTLSARGDEAALPAVLPLLDADDQGVRIAAIEALATLADQSAIAKLLAIAAKEGGAVQSAARRSLVVTRVPGADVALSRLARGADPRLRAEAVRALAARGGADATDIFLRAASDADPGVRREAFEALAQRGTDGDFARVLSLFLAAKNQADAVLLERALTSIARRAKDKAACRAPLLASLPKAQPQAKAAMLRLLASLGGQEALDAVVARLKDDAPQVVDATVRALASWRETAACPALLAIAAKSDNRVHKTLALRGYLHLAGTAAQQERLALLAKARALAADTQAKRMLLAVLAELDNPGAADLAASFLADPAVKTEAATALLAIAQRLTRTDRDAARRAAERLVASTEDPNLAAKARQLLAAAKRRPGRSAPARVPPHDPKRSQRIKAELAKRAPKGYRLVCYLDCGPDRADGAKRGPSLKLISGQPYMWAGSAVNGDTRYGSICFASTEVVFELSGLDPRKTYALGFSWWDCDHDTRRQSVWVAAGGRQTRLLPPTKLPSGSRGEKPAERVLPLPREATASGSARIIFKNEGTPNVVVSEVWLWESEAESDPPPTPGAARPQLSVPPLEEGRRARVLIVTGIDYPGHKWRQTAPALKQVLEKDPRLQATIVEDFNLMADPALAKFDVIVLHFMPWKVAPPTKAARENLARVLASGKGLVIIHFACGAFPDWPEFVKLAGKVYDRTLRGHDPRGAFKVRIVNHDHPITRGLSDLETNDELYTCLAGQTPITILAVAKSKVDGKDYPMAFVLNYGKGRVFHSPLGHDVKALTMPGVAELLRRGTAWAAGLPPPPPPGEEAGR